MTQVKRIAQVIAGLILLGHGDARASQRQRQQIKFQTSGAFVARGAHVEVEGYRADKNQRVHCEMCQGLPAKGIGEHAAQVVPQFQPCKPQTHNKQVATKARLTVEKFAKDGPDAAPAQRKTDHADQFEQVFAECALIQIAQPGGQQAGCHEQYQTGKRW